MLYAHISHFVLRTPCLARQRVAGRSFRRGERGETTEFPLFILPFSGKLVSPKWKNFKGLKLQWRDKIRLNNAIWRAWYMQYLEKRKNPVCHFVTPLDGSVEVDEHRRPEAITTEGKYWKSRIEIVIREYHKWRTYFKKRLQQHKDEDLSSLAQDDDLLYWHKHGDGWKTPVPMEEDALLSTDMLMSEFSDTLFSTLSSHPPVAWPNPREIAHLGNADMIQPGLIPLQPNLDFMDTFEPFQDLFSSSRSIFGSMLPAPASGPAPDHNSPPAESILPTTTLPTASLPDGFIAPPAATALDPTRGQGCEHTSQPGDPFLQPADLGPSAPPLSVPQPFLPVFTMPLLSPSPAPAPASPILPLGPPPATALNPPTPPAFLQPQKFAEVSKSPPVITHTASATLTHDASATTFSQSQGLIITTHYPTPSVSPCGLALSPVTRPPTVGPPQPRLTFVHPKPVSLPGGRHKQPPKIVPAPKPEPMSLVLKNACLAPGESGGGKQVGFSPRPHPPPGCFPSPGLQTRDTHIVIGNRRVMKDYMRRSSLFFLFYVVLLVSLNPEKLQKSSFVSIPCGKEVTSQWQQRGRVLLLGPPRPPCSLASPGIRSRPPAGPPPSPPPCSGSCLFRTAPSSDHDIRPSEERRDVGFHRVPVQHGHHACCHRQEFHSGILVTDLGHGTGSQPAPISRLFSPSTVTDSLVKGEQVPPHGGIAQVPATGTSRDCPNSGQASPCASEQSPSPQSPQNNCSGKSSADPKNVAALKAPLLGLPTWPPPRRASFDSSCRFSSCQQLLPATGVPVTRRQFDHMRDMFDEYVKSRTLQNWKFWIFSVIIKPLFESFKGVVSSSSLEELHRTALCWLDEHCSLPVLRPTVLNTLRHLSTTTSILTDPAQLPEQAAEAVTRMGQRSGES
eukprot:bmy_01447T0